MTNYPIQSLIYHVFVASIWRNAPEAFLFLFLSTMFIHWNAPKPKQKAQQLLNACLQGSSSHGLALLDFTVIASFSFSCLQTCRSIWRAAGKTAFICTTLQMYLFLRGSSSCGTRLQVYREWRLSSSCFSKYSDLNVSLTEWYIDKTPYIFPGTCSCLLSAWNFVCSRRSCWWN